VKKLSILFDRARLGSAVLLCLGASLLTGVRAEAQLVINLPAGGNLAAAVAQISAAGGGTINLAAGTYNLTSTLEIPSNITINGQGSTSILLGPKTPYTWDLIDDSAEGVSNIVFSNFVIDGNIPRGAYLVTPSGMNNPYGGMGINFNAYTYPFVNVTLQNIEVRNASEGIHLALMSGLTLNQVYAHDNVPGSFAHNVYLVDSTNVTVTHCRFDNAHAGDGLHFDFGGSNYLVTKSEFNGNIGYGILSQSPTTGATIQDSIFNFNQLNGDDNSVSGLLVQRSVASYNQGVGYYNIGGTGAYNYLFGVGNVGGLDTLYGLGGYGVTDLDLISTTTPNVYEAEFADGPTGATDTADWTTAYAGFSGGGAVDFNANHLSNGLLSFSHVGAVTAGNYSITFRYSNGSGGTLSMPLTVNGVARTPISFASTGSNSTWSTVNVTVPLNAGNNVIAISPSGTAAPEIDNLTVNSSTPSVPSAPTGLTATAVTPYQVNLTWNATAGAATYNVYQNGLPIAANVVATSYTDSRIFFGESTLSYTVAAVNQGGTGAVSSTVSVTTPIDTPAGLQVAAGSGAGNYLNWMSANGASYFNVKRSTVSGGPYTTLTGVTNTTNLTSTNFEQTYEDAAAAVGTTYYYVVSAVDASGKESANSYEVSFLTQPTPQTITFAAVPSQAVGNTLTLTATASSGLPVSYAAVANGVCTVSGSVVTFATTGSCGINASQAGNSTYAAAATVGQVITVVTPVAQTITFAAIPGQTAGTLLTLTATASSGLTVSYASSMPSVCTVSGATASLLAGGTCTLTASQSGGGTYAAATPVSQSFAVAAALQSQTITFNAIATQHVGTPLNVAGYASASSGLPITWTLVQNGNCSISGTTVTFINAGACGIIANQAGNATYAAATAVGQVVQVAGPLQSQTITFKTIATQKVGTPLNLTGYATASSGLAITWTYVNNGNCTISGTTVTFLNAGACGIIANQAGNGTYAAAPAVGQVVSVN
jgi:fibronectin type 3 domain-containing protein